MGSVLESQRKFQQAERLEGPCAWGRKGPKPCGGKVIGFGKLWGRDSRKGKIKGTRAFYVPASRKESWSKGPCRAMKGF